MIGLEMKKYKMTLKEQHYHRNYCQPKLIIMNIVQVKKYYSLIKVDWKNKLSLHIIFLENLQKNKQKQLKVKEEHKYMLSWIKMNDKLGLINKNGKNLLNKEIFEELAKERSDEIMGINQLNKFTDEKELYQR